MAHSNLTSPVAVHDLSDSKGKGRVKRKQEGRVMFVLFC